jgi:hypothetical protein
MHGIEKRIVYIIGATLIHHDTTSESQMTCARDSNGTTMVRAGIANNAGSESFLVSDVREISGSRVHEPSSKVVPDTQPSFAQREIIEQSRRFPANVDPRVTSLRDNLPAIPSRARPRWARGAARELRALKAPKDSAGPPV